MAATTFSDTELDFLSEMESHTKFYLLIWQNPVVLSAQVNQSTFTKDFVAIQYDSVTEGSYTNALEGYVVYLSKTSNINDHYMVDGPLRLRKNSTSTTLYTEISSLSIANNDYIFVVKDVRLKSKMFRVDNDVIYADYDLAYSPPKPLISGIKSAYFGIIKTAIGYIDIAINPAAIAVTSGATITTWTLLLDGGSQQSFSSSTGATIIRYTNNGNYMPRWSVTDSNGKVSWFTTHIFIENETAITNDNSNVININIVGGSIRNNVETGLTAKIDVFDGIQNILDNTFVAIYADMQPPTDTNNILFVGNINNDNIVKSHIDGYGCTSNVSIELLGVGSQMQSIVNTSWALSNVSTATKFGQLKDAAIWRAVAYYLQTTTNLLNIYSLSFSDINNDYIYPLWRFGISNLLSCITGVLWHAVMQPEWYPDGSINITTNANFLDDADKNNLPTIANWNERHWYTTGADGGLWDISNNHTLSVSRLRMGVGWHNTIADTIKDKMALVPSGAPSGAMGETVINGQIVKTNLTDAASLSAARNRAKQMFSYVQKPTLLNVNISDVFATKLIPSMALWHTNTIQPSDNLKGDYYTISDRWLLISTSIDIKPDLSRSIITAEYRLASYDLGYNAVLQAPPAPQNYTNPTIPPIPPIDNLPPIDPTSFTPTGGFSDGTDSPPITPNDLADTRPVDPNATNTTNNNSTTLYAIAWTEEAVFISSDFSVTVTPSWLDTSLPLGDGHYVQMATWDRYTAGKSGVYTLSNNDELSDAETIVYTSRDLPRGAFWQTRTLDDILATMVNACAANQAIIYGKSPQSLPPGSSPLRLLRQPNGPGTPVYAGKGDLAGSNFIAPHAGSVNAPGVYVSSTDDFRGVDTGNGFSCNVELPLPAGITITAVLWTITYDKDIDGGGTPVGEDDCQLAYENQDGNIVAFGVIYDCGATPTTIGITTFGLSIFNARKLFVHLSVKKVGPATYIRLIGLRVSYTVQGEHAITKFSDDFNNTWKPYRYVGQLSLGEGSMTRRVGLEVLAAMDAKIKAAWPAGSPYDEDADQSDTPGEYAVAMLKFTSTQDYLFATETKLYKVVNDVRTDITPNDGSNDGIIINKGCLAMCDSSVTRIWALCTFGGEVKLAYTSDQGENWSFNDTMSNSANWLFVHPNSDPSKAYVDITDNDIIWHSTNGGISFIEIAGPVGQILKGVEVL